MPGHSSSDRSPHRNAGRIGLAWQPVGQAASTDVASSETTALAIPNTTAAMTMTPPAVLTPPAAPAWSWDAPGVPVARPTREISLSMLADVLGYAQSHDAVWMDDLRDEPILLTEDLYQIVTLLHAQRTA